MQVVGFNFTKISAEKLTSTKKADLNADIQFLSLDKQKIEILKESEGVKLVFKHSLNYKDNEKKDSLIGEIVFQGTITLSLTKDEHKEVMKTWKNKHLPGPMQLSLYNFILKRCAIHALTFQNELNLPSHIQIPKLAMGQKS